MRIYYLNIIVTLYRLTHAVTLSLTCSPILFLICWAYDSSCLFDFNTSISRHKNLLHYILYTTVFDLNSKIAEVASMDRNKITDQTVLVSEI